MEFELSHFPLNGSQGLISQCSLHPKGRSAATPDSLDHWTSRLQTWPLDALAAWGSAMPGPAWGLGCPSGSRSRGCIRLSTDPRMGPQAPPGSGTASVKTCLWGSVISGLTTILSIGFWEGSRIRSPNPRAPVTRSYSKPCPGCQHTTGSPWPASVELAACGGCVTVTT